MLRTFTCLCLILSSAATSSRTHRRYMLNGTQNFPAKSKNINSAPVPDSYHIYPGKVDDGNNVFGCELKDGRLATVGSGMNLNENPELNEPLNFAFVYFYDTTGFPDRHWVSTWDGRFMGCVDIPGENALLIAGMKNVNSGMVSDGKRINEHWKRSLTKLSYAADTVTETWTMMFDTPTNEYHSAYEGIVYDSANQRFVVGGFIEHKNVLPLAEWSFKSGGSVIYGTSILETFPLSKIQATAAPSTDNFFTWVYTDALQTAVEQLRVHPTNGEVFTVTRWTGEPPQPKVGKYANCMVNRISTTGQFVAQKDFDGVCTDLEIATDGESVAIGGYVTPTRTKPDGNPTQVFYAQVINLPKDFVNAPSTNWVAQFTPTPDPESGPSSSMHKTECWGIGQDADGFILGCGTGIENCALPPSEGVPPGEAKKRCDLGNVDERAGAWNRTGGNWMGMTAKVSKYNGAVQWFRTDQFGNDVSHSSAVEYVVVMKNGMIASITDETPGVGLIMLNPAKAVPDWTKVPDYDTEPKLCPDTPMLSLSGDKALAPTACRQKCFDDPACNVVAHYSTYDLDNSRINAINCYLYTSLPNVKTCPDTVGVSTDIMYKKAMVLSPPLPSPPPVSPSSPPPSPPLCEDTPPPGYPADVCAQYASLCTANELVKKYCPKTCEVCGARPVVSFSARVGGSRRKLSTVKTTADIEALCGPRGGADIDCVDAEIDKVIATLQVAGQLTVQKSGSLKDRDWAVNVTIAANDNCLETMKIVEPTAEIVFVVLDEYGMPLNVEIPPSCYDVLEKTDVSAKEFDKIPVPINWPYLRTLYALFVALLGVSVPVAYVMILANASGQFSVEDASPSYVNSPYWLTIPRGVRPVLILFQLLAVVGYIGFQTWIVLHMDKLTASFLQHRGVLVYMNISLILSAAIWPVPAYYVVAKPGSALSTLASAICLWITASSGLLFLIGLILESAPTVVVIGSVAFCIVTVLADGMWWVVASVRRYMRYRSLNV